MTCVMALMCTVTDIIHFYAVNYYTTVSNLPLSLIHLLYMVFFYAIFSLHKNEVTQRK